MGLFDLVKQDDAVGAPTDRLCQLAALVITDVAGRRANQARDGMLLHVLRHVEADHGLLVVEEKLRKRTGRFRFAHASGTEEDEAADGTLGITEARARTANRVGD